MKQDFEPAQDAQLVNISIIKPCIPLDLELQGGQSIVNDILAVGGIANISVDVFNAGDPLSKEPTPSHWKVGNKVMDVTANIFNFSNDLGRSTFSA